MKKNMKKFIAFCIYNLILPMGISAQEAPEWFTHPEKGEYVGVSIPMDNEAIAEKSAEYAAILSYIMSLRKEELKQKKYDNATPHRDETEIDTLIREYNYKLFSTDKGTKSSIGSMNMSVTDSRMEEVGEITTSIYSTIRGKLDYSLDESFIVTKRKKDDLGNIWIAIKPNQAKGNKKHYEGKCAYSHRTSLFTSSYSSESVEWELLGLFLIEINKKDSSLISYDIEIMNDSVNMNVSIADKSIKGYFDYSDKFQKTNYDSRHLQTFLGKELQTTGYNASGVCGISQYSKSMTASYTASILNLIAAFIAEEDKSSYLNGLNNVGNFFASGYSQCYYMPSVVEDKPQYAVTVEERENNNTFVVAIGNEDYQQVENVPYAHNDVKAFAEYCQRTLNIPEKQISIYENATYGTMHMALKRLKEVSKAYQGDLKIVFYYAGHGIPDEESNNSYLLPTDADGTMPEVCYSLNQLYSELGSMDAKQVVVFMDACFSGSKRDGGMLQSARGVAIKAKEGALRGNMIVFSAASGEQTAYPYKPQEHGLFTYYLLSKLQKDNGNMTLGELADYIKSEVSRTSIVENKKAQMPNISISPSLSNNWKTLKLK